MVTIFIDKETRSRLQNLGSKNQTYDDIINELIDISKRRSVNSAKSIEQVVL